MTVKHYKPTTPGRRGMSTLSNDTITKSKPEKRLRKSLKRRSGRNNSGNITIHHKGGGHKKLYRTIDFKRFDKKNIEGKVVSIEYDPYRTSNIILVNYKDGEKRYHIAPQSIKTGDKILLAEKTKIKPGNRMLIKNIPIGFNIYNLELTVGKGGQLIRSAGACAKVVSQENQKKTLVEMPSGEIRLINKECYASVGQVSNITHMNVKIGKAGRSRNMGRRPTVRGKVKNPVDHPHGGGEGNQPIGLKHPKTPWGMPALGFKTRKRKYSDKFIVKSRHRK